MTCGGSKAWLVCVLVLAGMSTGGAALAVRASATAPQGRPAAAGAATSLSATVPLAARAFQPLDKCGSEGIVCKQVSVPLDWTGQTQGKLSLEVKEHKPAGASRGVMFMLAGGPGQASADIFDIGQFSFWQALFPGYTLITFNPRGTGGPSLISCGPDGNRHSTAATLVAACGARLGQRSADFATSDNVMDIDAVRQAFGFDRIGLFGVSYGTDVALTYARTFPTHVERLLLDSVAAPVTAFPVVSTILRAIPPTLKAYCARVCSGVTSNYAGDVAAYANTLALAPIHGRVTGIGRVRRPVRIDAMDFLQLVLQSDLDPGLAAELPAAVHAARGGDTAPLLRLASLVGVSDAGGEVGAVYFATSCADGPFPWSPDTPVPQRAALFAGALAALPKSATGAFGAWAELVGNAVDCLKWPATATAPPSTDQSYPNVPVLALSGDLDLRAPRLEARKVVAQFPHGHLLTVTNTGHSVLTAAATECPSTAVRQWLSGKSVPSSCAGPRLISPIATFPAAVHVRQPAAAGSLLPLVEKTLGEAEASYVLGSYEELRGAVPGLAGGNLTLTRTGLKLADYRTVSGIALTGELRARVRIGDSLSFQGVVQIDDGGKAAGALAVNKDGLTGTLEGRSIAASRVSGPVPSGAAARVVRGWSSWAPAPGSPSEVTRAIAAHVASEYRLDASGGKLLKVTASPLRAPASLRGGPIAAIAIAKPQDRVERYEVQVTSGSWSYTLCAAAGRCSLPGVASVTRGRLVRREALELALELALDTFHFEPSLTSVVIYLPPGPGLASERQALYVQRSQLTGELSRPLATTLPLATPPLPTEPDQLEAAKIDRLTDRDLFLFFVFPVFGSIDDLVLDSAA